MRTTPSRKKGRNDQRIELNANPSVLEELRSLASEAGPSMRLSSLDGSFRDAQEAGDRVSQIVKDFGVFSHKETEARTAVDVERVLESSLRMAWNEIRHRARVVRNYGKAPRVYASESRLGQVFLNLIVNAAQALPDGQADRKQITVSTRTDAAGRVVVEMKDNGPGIPAELLNNILAPFFTTKPVGAVTGPGLEICSRIVEDLGGTISVESKVGEGSVFRVVLDPAPAGEKKELAQAAPTPPVRRRGNIMVIDDEPMIGMAVTRALSAQHDVLSLTMAADALKILASGQHFDVIFCDLMMPTMTGADFYRRLAETMPEQAARVVFLTGGAFTEPARKLLESVDSARMEKPFKLLALRALVNERVN